jgi:hypothetical protein
MMTCLKSIPLKNPRLRRACWRIQAGFFHPTAPPIFPGFVILPRSRRRFDDGGHRRKLFPS